MFSFFQITKDADVLSRPLSGDVYPEGPSAPKMVRPDLHGAEFCSLLFSSSRKISADLNASLLGTRTFEQSLPILIAVLNLDRG